MSFPSGLLCLPVEEQPESSHLVTFPQRGFLESQGESHPMQ